MTVPASEPGPDPDSGQAPTGKLVAILAGLAACLWSWSVAYAAVLSGEVSAWTAGTGPMPMAVLLYPSGALLAALTLVLATGEGNLTGRLVTGLGLRASFWASLKSWAWGLGLAFAATLIAHLLGQGSPLGAERAARLAGPNAAGLMSNPHDVMVMLVMQAVLFSLLFGALLTLPEEVLWRGALARRWAGMPPLRRGLLTGALHGLWSVPMVGLGALGHPPEGWLGPLCWLAIAVALGPALDRVRARSGGALAPALMRAGYLGLAGALSLTLAPEASWAGAYGLGGVVAGAALSALLLRERTGAAKAIET